MATVLYGDNYEWNEQKNAANKAKHGIAFEVAIKVFDDVYIEAPSTGQHDEKRMLAIGQVNEKELVVIYTSRDIRKRIISARRARTYERETYQAYREAMASTYGR